MNNVVRPLPVVRDGNGKIIKDYTTFDWFAKLNEELDEIKTAVINRDNKLGSAAYVAEELQDLITVCTSYLQHLGFDEVARDKICTQVNEKNRRRGYLEGT